MAISAAVAVGGALMSVLAGKAGEVVAGAEGVSFYTRGKVITSRWPHVTASADASLHLPTAP